MHRVQNLFRYYTSSECLSELIQKPYSIQSLGSVLFEWTDCVRVYSKTAALKLVLISGILFLKSPEMLCVMQSPSCVEVLSQCVYAVEDLRRPDKEPSVLATCTFFTASRRVQAPEHAFELTSRNMDFFFIAGLKCCKGSIVYVSINT